MRARLDTMRNDLTWLICNTLINHLAVGQYRAYLKTVYGMGVQRFDEEFWKKYEEQKKDT